jgi:hypothetical protein
MSKIASSAVPPKAAEPSHSAAHDSDEDHGEKGDDDFVKEFTPAEGMTSEEAARLLEQWGRNELEEKDTPLW